MRTSPALRIRGSSLAAEIVKINPETPDMRMVSYVADRIKAGQVVVEFE